MISKKMLSAMNEQIANEQYSAHIYLAMAAYFHDQGYDGMAHWMKVQAREELGHAMKFFEHIVERQGRVELKSIDAPKKDWASPLDAFKAAYAHEQFITGKINDLCKLAESEKDNASSIFLQWFVTEQVEEEANAAKIVQMLERIGDAGHALIMIDVQLGKRE